MFTGYVWHNISIIYINNRYTSHGIYMLESIRKYVKNFKIFHIYARYILSI